MRASRALLILAASAIALTAMPAAASAEAINCPQFQVVRPDPFAGFPVAGFYGRQNFGPRGGPIQSCNTTYHVFQSFLYDSTPFPGYNVSRGTTVPNGPFRGRRGRIFTTTSNRLEGFVMYLQRATRTSNRSTRSSRR